MKRPFASAVTMATLVVAATAFGASDAPQAPAASTDSGMIGVATLSGGRLPAPPKGKKRPTVIPASERAPGFFFAKAKNGRRFADFTVLASSDARAKEIAEGRGFGGEAAAHEACFAEEQANWAGFGDEEDVERTWTAALQPQIMLNTAAGNGRPRVQAVHSERLVQEPGGGVVLESADAWVDPLTRGARLIGRSTLPLTRVATVLGGSVVYAGKDERTVHVILTAPPNPDSSRRGTQLFAAVDGGLATSQCSYIRVPLETEKGQGRTATFVSELQLQTLTQEGKPVPEDRAKVQPPRAAPFVRTERLEHRFRPVHVHASVSWAARDKDAVLTVASGWDARERTQAF